VSAGTLEGTAAYRERIALPPDAVFEAVLQDISRADAPAKVLGRAIIDPAGQPPFRFEIAYDDAAVQPDGAIPFAPPSGTRGASSSPPTGPIRCSPGAIRRTGCHGRWGKSRRGRWGK
jgi:hypothetical protein